MEIEISYEEERWCGFRKPAKNGVGIYLMGSRFSEPCERLPFPTPFCTVCGQGIQPSRGFTWIEPTRLFDSKLAPQCSGGGKHFHTLCPMCNPAKIFTEEQPKAGLLWIGEQFYPTPQDFMQEADQQGISRKVNAIPRGFQVGVDFIFLAHAKAIQQAEDGKVISTPGIFSVFRPERVDLVVNTDNPKKLPRAARRLAKQLGERTRLVKVIPKKPTQITVEEVVHETI